MNDACLKLSEEVYDLIKDICDPEKPQTLEDLEVVSEAGVTVKPMGDAYLVQVELTPTVPHCSLATLLGLCVRIKLERNFQYKFKLDVTLKKESHETADEINKQINDKERVTAAMENPSLHELVEKCINLENLPGH